MKKSNKKPLILAIVALILVLVSFVSFTYSWIDDIKLVEFQNDNLAQNGAPLKTGTDINASVKINKTENTIDLGNMLTNEDITYEYTENGETKRHIKYDTKNTDNTKNPNMNTINEKKGYFYESGGMHLSPCVGDGERFYFQRQGTSGYREGNKDDENVNYISITLKVSSPDANVDFWFRNEPSICIKGTNTKIANARYAIIVDGQSHVYSNSGSALTCNSDLNGTQPVQGVRKTSIYTYNSSDNITSERGKNSNTLFSIKKGNTVNMTIKIWLENGIPSTITASDINFQLVSSWAYTRTITIEDDTTGPEGTSWIGNNSAKLYLVLPEFLKAKDPDVSHWWSQLREKGAPIFSLTSANDSNKYTVTLPLVYNNEEMYIYRCNSEGWNDTGSDASARSSYEVYCWNWWGTRTPNTYRDEKYTLYGCSMDESANYCFKFQLNDNNSFPAKTELPNQGYGTWGGVDLISVYSEYSGTDYVPKNVTENNDRKTQKLFVRDFSDYNSSGDVYIYEMCRLPSTDTNNDGKIDNKDDVIGSDPWKTYVPKSSSHIQFSAFSSSNSLFGVWGYNSWRSNDNDLLGDCPQQRPLINDFYSENATVYHIAGNDSDNNHHTYGRGYWESGGQYVYLIKSGNMAGVSTAYANLVDEHVTDHYKYQNSVMSNLRSADNTKDIEFVRGNTSYYVCKSSDGVNYNTDAYNKNIYRDVNFNNNTSENNNWTVQSGNKRLYPGCFYHFSEQKWYGSLTDTGRSASTGGGSSGESSGGSGGGEGTGSGESIEGFTIESDFTIQVNNNTYTVYQNSDGTQFKARVALTTGSNSNWMTVQKNGTDYGLQESGNSYSVPSTTINLYLVSGQKNNFRLNASSAGNYIVTFEYDNGNTGTIRIKSVSKES